LPELGFGFGHQRRRPTGLFWTRPARSGDL